MLLFAAVRSDRYLDFTELRLPHAISYAQLIEVKTTINKYDMFVPVTSCLMSTRGSLREHKSSEGKPRLEETKKPKTIYHCPSSCRSFVSSSCLQRFDIVSVFFTFLFTDREVK